MDSMWAIFACLRLALAVLLLVSCALRVCSGAVQWQAAVLQPLRMMQSRRVRALRMLRRVHRVAARCVDRLKKFSSGM